MPYRFSRLLAVTRLLAPHGPQASRPMRPLRHLLLPGALLLAVGGQAHATLPPPALEQQQAADAKKAKEADEAKRRATNEALGVRTPWIRPSSRIAR